MKLLLLFLFFKLSIGAFIGPNSIELNEKYKFIWEIHGSDIEFEVTAQTTGFIGFGLSWQGKMKDADIYIMGVNPDLTPYLEDRHGIGNSIPIMDSKNDLKLISANENNTQTTVKFSRKLNSCDPEDIQITDDTIKIIWAYGPTDKLEFHDDNKGVGTVNLIDGITPIPDLSPYKVWNVTNNILMPKNDTTYWCSFHKAPQLNKKKHHLIGFDVFLSGDLAKAHTHHADLYKCVVPEGMNPDEIFGEFAEGEGQECYYDPTYYPREYCQTMEFSWSIGGQITMFPENVGVPFGVIENEYYMMELHYDNPREAEEKFQTGLQLYYIDTPREHDAGFLMVKKHSIYNLMIPPNGNQFLAPAHCSSQCTQHIPQEGVNVFNVKVHSHLAGRKMKVRHFRNGNELPWIVNDEYYDFNYQQNKMLKEELKLYAGDHITLECIYDTTWKNGLATLGGLTTREEMCIAYLLYYPLLDNLHECGSNFPAKQLIKHFGITEVKMGASLYDDPIVTKPASLANQTFTQVIESKTWTKEFYDQFQIIYKETDQEAFCGLINNTKTNYPKFEIEYQLPEQCNNGQSTLYSIYFILCSLVIVYLK